MSEEEKKAIEYLKNKIDYNKNKIKEIENKNDTLLIGYGTMHDVYKIQNCQYLILLNCITKLQKENEKYKYLYQKVLDNTVKTDRENIQLKKQIDLMAKAFKQDDVRSVQEIKQYFERKVEN